MHDPPIDNVLKNKKTKRLTNFQRMSMSEEPWMREGWEIPGSDDEMEYDLTKCIDSKLTACFDALTYVFQVLLSERSILHLGGGAST